MKPTLYDVFQGRVWIGCALAENADAALLQVVGDEPQDDEGFRAVRAVNTRICSDGRSV